jgi:hypothetical protein
VPTLAEDSQPLQSFLHDLDLHAMVVQGGTDHLML